MIKWYSSSYDIDDQKRIENALRQSEAYLSEAQKLSHTGSFGWNASTKQLFWSDETFRVFGYETTETPSLQLILQRTHPDDVALVYSMVDRIAAGAKDLDFEHRLLMPDGSIKHLHVMAHAAPHGDDPTQFIGAVSDITVRKEAYAALAHSEQRYRYLFNHMPIALLQLRAHEMIEEFERLRTEGLTDLGAHFDAHPDLVRRFTEQLIIEEVNGHTVRMLGGRDATEIVGHSASRHWPELSSETLRRALESRYRGDAYFQEETKWATLDGRIIDVLFTTTRFAQIGDSGISLIGVVDVTDRVRALEMLNRMQADFAHAARVSVLGELTASIAHEVNQPLAAIAANGQVGLRWLQRADPDLGEVRELTESIVADAQRAADIIGRVRAMAARRSPEQTLLCLDDVIREALVFLRHELQARRVTVSHHPTRNPLMVLGDRTQLQQVVVNLMVNSIQAMVQAESTRRTITITITSCVPDPATVLCQIDDSGPGVKAEFLSRPFESFFTTKDGGMGMGLPICRSIIEAHGGRISADNCDAEGGACFSFALPAAARQD